MFACTMYIVYILHLCLPVYCLHFTRMFTCTLFTFYTHVYLYIVYILHVCLPVHCLHFTRMFTCTLLERFIQLGKHVKITINIINNNLYIVHIVHVCLPVYCLHFTRMFTCILFTFYTYVYLQMYVSVPHWYRPRVSVAHQSTICSCESALHLVFQLILPENYILATMVATGYHGHMVPVVKWLPW